MEHVKIKTLGELNKSGWTSMPIAAEMRKNAIEAIRSGRGLFDGIHGYENTVMPQLETAILAGHDVILLGERGQGKSRIIRSLVSLLDEWMPIVEGSEINDDPTNPVSVYAKELIAKNGDETPIAWVHRSARFGEKLATPDTSMADLIGDVDPIKVAEGRYLSDELTMHFGLVPRTNRGIFAINELPDLSERIQVGLLSILEERDIQIRGYRISLPLDIFLIASANPEDYTNRGRLITPLKDRFGSQIRTHYPLSSAIELEIVDQEALFYDDEDSNIYFPQHLRGVVALVSELARRAPNINQKSGVSVRATVANYEALSAAALRRTLISDSPDAVVRPCDFWVLASSMSGKIELDTVDDTDEVMVISKLVDRANLEVFRSLVTLDELRPLVATFDEGFEVTVGEDGSDEHLAKALESSPETQLVIDRIEPSALPQAKLGALEFVLEGLHLAKRLNKYEGDAGSIYAKRTR
ncbi:sigma 54-interacting transcriptional regulator [Acidithrix ferrooxidans]|nr:sigma 54-interacting transcriptional regulator [Acidithrix ferrooxidans]